MEPLIILVVLPVLIGVTAELIFRDTKRASLAAALGCAMVVFLCLTYLDPVGTLSWLAALLVAPFALALSLAAVFVTFGHGPPRKRNHGHDG